MGHVVIFNYVRSAMRNGMSEEAPSRLAAGLLIGSFIFLGVGFVLARKFTYGIESVGLDGNSRVFHKPFFIAFCAVFGPALILPCGVCCTRGGLSTIPKMVRNKNGRSVLRWLILPAFLTSAVSMLDAIALVNLGTSLYQMLRVSKI